MMTDSETCMTALQGQDFSGSKYGNEDRINAVVSYLINGTYTKAEKATGIPASTIRTWAKSEWWQQLSVEVRALKEEEFRAGFSRLIDAGIARTEDALLEGEIKLVKTKEGYEERRVPVGAKDATTIAAIAYDKLRLSENLPTAITQSESSKSLQAQLEELSDRLNEREKKIVSEQ
jgi:hypothetical protein